MKTREITYLQTEKEHESSKFKEIFEALFPSFYKLYYYCQNTISDYK